MQGQLAKLMAKQMVEPKRKTIDVEKIWLDKRAEKKREKGETMELKRIRSPSPHRPEKRKKAKVELESSVLSSVF